MNKLLFKRIDFWLQTALILTSFMSFIIFTTIVLFFDKVDGNSFLIFVISLFAVIFFQFLSMIFNLLNSKIITKKWRKLYEKIALVLIILLILSFVFYSTVDFRSFFDILDIIVYIFAPILAIRYLVITWFELKEMEKEAETLTKK